MEAQNRDKPAAILITNETKAVLLLSTLLIFAGAVYPDSLSAAYDSLHHPLGVSRPILSLGDIPVGEPSKRSISVFNGHIRPIIIESAGSDCGCTVATPPQQISPLHFGDILLTITPRSSGKGGQTIRVKTSVGKQEIAIGFNGIDQQKSFDGESK